MEQTLNKTLNTSFVAPRDLFSDKKEVSDGNLRKTLGKLRSRGTDRSGLSCID